MFSGDLGKTNGSSIFSNLYVFSTVKIGIIQNTNININSHIQNNLPKIFPKNKQLLGFEFLLEIQKTFF